MNDGRRAVRARRCPRAIAGVWALEAAFALAFAWPVASAIGRSVGRGPAGDGVLWAPGGRALVSLLTRSPSVLADDVTLASIVAAAAALTSLVPTAALMIAMIHAASRARITVARAVAGAVRALPTLIVLFLTALVARVVLGGAAALAAWLVEGWAHDRYGEARAEGLEALTLVVFVLPFAAVGLVHDLARATAVHLRASALGAARQGLRAFGRAPWSTAWSWTWREGAAAAFLTAGWLAATKLGGRGGLALAGLACVHQGAAFSRVALRASWIAKTLRTIPEPRSLARG